MEVALLQGAEEEETCRATDQGCKWVGGWGQLWLCLGFLQSAVHTSCAMQHRGCAECLSDRRLPLPGRSITRSTPSKAETPTS